MSVPDELVRTGETREDEGRRAGADDREGHALPGAHGPGLGVAHEGLPCLPEGCCYPPNECAVMIAISLYRYKCRFHVLKNEIRQTAHFGGACAGWEICSVIHSCASGPQIRG